MCNFLKLDITKFLLSNIKVLNCDVFEISKNPEKNSIFSEKKKNCNI